MTNKITVISPDGISGDIPAEQWLDAKAQGFSLPQAPAIASDITEDRKQVNVINPDGKPGSIPIEQFDAAKAQGYKLASQDKPQQEAAHEARVQQELRTSDDLRQGSLSDIPSKYKAVEESHKQDQVQDKEGNYLFKTPNGEILPIKPDQLDAALQDKNLKFADDNFQTLIEARMRRGLQHSGSTSITQGLGAASNTATLLPAGDMVDNYRLGAGGVLADFLGKSDTGNVQKADLIASKLLRPEFQTARTIGTIAGIGANIATPGFGKVGAIESLIPSAGATLLKQVAAKAATGAIEGAILSAPQALAQSLIMKDTKGAAESLGLGIGIGGFLGGAGKLAGIALEKLSGSAAREAQAGKYINQIGATEDTVKTLQSADVKSEKFLNTLREAGISPASSPKQMEAALRSITTGEHLTGTLQSLDKVSEGISSSSLINKIGTAAEGGQLSFFADPESTKVISQLTKKLTDTASTKGELTLSSLQKFTNDVGHEVKWNVLDNAANNVKKQVFKDAATTLLEAGDLAAQKADAKVATAWSENKIMSQASEQIREELIKNLAEGGKLSPIAAKIKDMLTGKAAAIAGGSAGAVVGGLPGALIGGAVGEGAARVLKNTADNLTEKYIGNPDNSSKLVGWLTKNKGSTAIGSYIAMDALHSVGEKISNIAPFVANLSEKTPSVFIANENPIKQMLGAQANGLSKEQQFNRLSNNIASLAGNPELMNQQIQSLTDTVSKDHPELAMQMQQDLNNKILYIHQILHGKNSSDVAEPFKKQEVYKPTTADLKEMEDQLKIAQNPFALLEGLKNGKISSKQVATASILNPTILQQIRSEITKQAYSGKSNLTYQQRLAASVIMGQAMDQSLKMVPQLQSAYASQGQSSGPQPSGKAPKLNTSKMPSAQGTTAQRISGK